MKFSILCYVGTRLCLAAHSVIVKCIVHYVHPVVIVRAFLLLFSALLFQYSTIYTKIYTKFS